MSKLLRVILAAIFGGALMFVWGFVGHMFLGIGSSSMTQIPDEQQVVSAMKEKLKEPALYVAPWNPMMDGKPMSDVEQKAFEERTRGEPVVFLVYHPTNESNFFKQLTIEFLSNAGAAMLAALILIHMRSGYLSRLIACVLIGLAGWMSLSLSYWNWYQFPWPFIWQEAIDQGAGWFVSGIAIAAFANGRSADQPKPAGA